MTTATQPDGLLCVLTAALHYDRGYHFSYRKGVAINAGVTQVGLWFNIYGGHLAWFDQEGEEVIRLASCASCKGEVIEGNVVTVDVRPIKPLVLSVPPQAVVKPEVLKAIESELAYSQGSYSRVKYSAELWLTILQTQATRALEEFTDEAAAKDQVRKIATIAVVALEQCGSPLRKEAPPKEDLLKP